MWGKNKKINELIRELNQQQEIDIEDINYIQQSYITREDNILHMRIYLMQIMENGVGIRGGNINQNPQFNLNGQYGNSNYNLNSLNEFRQIIQALQSIEKYRSQYEDLIIAKYSDYTVSKSNPLSNIGVKALGFKIFSKIHKLNVAYLSKIQTFFPKLYEIIFQDQLALNTSFKENAAQLIAAPKLTLGKIFALVAKGGRQRLQKELTKLQNYTTQYPNLAQEKNKNNKNERFYTDKNLQGIESFTYIINLQKKYFLRQQLPYKTFLSQKKAKGINMNNTGNIQCGYGGTNVYDEIMNIDKKKGNEGSTNGVQNSSQNLYFSKEYESIFEIILSNYEKYMKDYIQSNKYIGFKIRQYTQNVVSQKPINKKHPLYNHINHKNQEKEDQNRIKYLQQTGQLNNQMNLQNIPQQQSQLQRGGGSSNNLDRQISQPNLDLSSRNSLIKQSPQKNIHRQFQSITLTQINADSEKFNQNRKKLQEQIQQNQQNQIQFQSQNSNANLGKNITSFMTIKKFQMPTAPIFLSNTINLKNHSSKSNRNKNEDAAAQNNFFDDNLKNNKPTSNTVQNLNTYGTNKPQEKVRTSQSQNSQPPPLVFEQNKFCGENSSIDQSYQPQLLQEIENNTTIQKRGSKYMKTENQSTLDNVELLSISEQNNQQLNSINTAQPSAQITNVATINEYQNRQIIPSQISFGVFNDDSTKNSQNTFVDLQQTEQKLSNNQMGTKTPVHFNSLNSLDLQPQQRDFLAVTTAPTQHQSHSTMPNYRSQLPSTVQKKSKQLNNLQEIQQVNKIIQGQNQQQFLQAQPNIFSSTATTGQQRFLYAQQQQHAQKRGSGLSGQNVPQLLGNNLVGFPFQALLMNNITNNGGSSTKNNFRYQQFGQQNQNDINLTGRQSLNFPFASQSLGTQESANSSQFNTDEQNINELNKSESISNQMKFRNAKKISSSNQFLVQSQQLSSMAYNNLLQQQEQFQKEQMQKDSIQQNYIQQQQQNIQLKQQLTNPQQAAYYINPNTSDPINNTSQQQLTQKQINQSKQYSIPTNAQYNITGPQAMTSQFPNIGIQQKQQDPEQCLLLQSQNQLLYQTHSLQKIPSSNNIQVPITQQSGNVNKLSQSNKTFHSSQNMNQNNMNQKYIAQDVSLKKLRNSLSTNPKEINSKLLNNFGQSTHIRSSKINSEQSKNNLIMTYNQNGIASSTCPTHIDEKIIEENIRNNTLEKQDINSVNKPFKRNSEGSNNLNNKPNTTRNYTQMYAQQTEEDKLQEQDNYFSNDLYLKTSQMKKFVISQPRKIINSQGQKNNNNQELKEQISSQNQSLFIQKSSFLETQTTPVVIQTQMC